MTGTLYGTATFHWARGFFFGAALGAIAALIMIFKVKRPTVEQMEEAVRKHEEREAVQKTAVA
jgi:MFS transporter, OFA family, oxalate/formate antiporter